jgi:dTDP-4-dehydrorhamnose 3,5-epimerase-like enzyme
MNLVQIINGGFHEDQRGKVSFVNDFDMTLVKRFYQINHPHTDIIRAWQGHQKESKWFYCVEGSFTINYVQPKNWINSNGDEKVERVEISHTNPQVLQVPSGFVTGIKANIPNSILLVYSDFTLLESKLDDFRFDLNTWSFKN